MVGNTATIVIPSHGRPQQLAACLGAIAELEGGPWEVIVVDDGSDTPLSPICAAAGPHVRCVRQANAGPAAARNTGVEAAATELVLFTDDDCRPRPEWALKLVAAQGEVPMRLAGGHVENALERNLFSETSQSIQTHLYGTFGRFDGPDSFFASNNIACRREDFLALGGFDTAYTFASEDRDLSRRWRDAGGHLHYTPEAVVAHHHHLTARSFGWQHWQYGRGGRRYHRRRADGKEPPVFANPASFYAGILLHPLRRPGARTLAISGLIGVAHAIQLGGYLAERRSERAE